MPWPVQTPDGNRLNDFPTQPVEIGGSATLDGDLEDAGVFVTVQTLESPCRGFCLTARGLDDQYRFGGIFDFVFPTVDGLHSGQNVYARGEAFLNEGPPEPPGFIEIFCRDIEQCELFHGFGLASSALFRLGLRPMMSLLSAPLILMSLVLGFVGCGATTGGSVSEAEGRVDEAFQAKLGTGFNGPVDAVAVQADGKILVAGRFTVFNGQTTGPLVRLDADGNFDSGFAAHLGASFNDDVFALALTSDAKILVAGRFTSLQGANAAYVARLNADGTRDTAFNPVGTGFDGTASVLSLSGDLIYVGGQFSNYKGQTAGRIARLLGDGTLDTSFAPGLGFNLGVDAIAVESDGRILVGGSFTTFNSATRNRLVRLGVNGALDTDFQASIGLGFDGAVTAIGVGDRTIVSGEFTRFDVTTTSSMISVGSGGTGLVDLKLDAKAHVLLQQANGKWIAAGEFSNMNLTASSRLVRFNADGTVDTAFVLKTGSGLDNDVYSGAMQSDGKLLLGGAFTTANSIAAPRLVRFL